MNYSAREFSEYIFNNYEKFSEKSFADKFIKHTDIVKLIENKNNYFQIEVAGKSTLGREIFLIKFGKGKKKIFLWSQMHGDEPTATMAIFDILNYFHLYINSKEVQTIFNNTTIYFLPMVNPDGAEIFTRRNIFGIDLNRDALLRNAKESKILFKTQNKINPDFGFNLHDQDPRYTSGKNKNVSAIALLTPPINNYKTENKVVNKAKKVASQLAEILEKYIPNNVSRYIDDFEVRAFGETFQKKGMSTVLIESGGWRGDSNKFFIRKLNCIGLISTFYSVATEEFLNKSKKIYERLPVNEKYLYDFVFRKVKISIKNTEIITDIGINYEDAKRKKVRVMEIGDLRNFGAFENYILNKKIISAELIKWDSILSLNKMKKIFGL